MEGEYCGKAGDVVVEMDDGAVQITEQHLVKELHDRAKGQTVRGA